MQKNVYIIHNSKFGNSEKISKIIAEALKDKNNVKVYNIRTLNIEKIEIVNPEVLVIGVRIIMFSADKKLIKFLKKLSIHFNNHNPKLVLFFTHSAFWTKRYFEGIIKELKEFNCYNNIYPKYLELSIKGQKGPIKNGQDNKIQFFIQKLLEFLG